MLAMPAKLAWFSPTFSHLPCFPQVNWALPGAAMVLIPGCVGCVHSRILWAPPKDSPVRLAIFSCLHNPHRFLQPEVLRLYFLALETLLARSISLPSCSSWFILTGIWDRLVHQPPPCHASSLTLLPIFTPPTGLDKCSFLNPWLSDFHKVRFSGSSMFVCFF